MGGRAVTDAHHNPESLFSGVISSSCPLYGSFTVASQLVVADEEFPASHFPTIPPSHICHNQVKILPPPNQDCQQAKNNRK